MFQESSDMTICKGSFGEKERSFDLTPESTGLHPEVLAISIAILNSNVGEFREIIDHSHDRQGLLGLLDVQGGTIAHQVAHLGDAPFLEFLASEGVCGPSILEEKDNIGWTPAIWAALNETPDCLDVIVRLSPSGPKALAYLVIPGYASVWRLLIECGVPEMFDYFVKTVPGGTSFFTTPNPIGELGKEAMAPIDTFHKGNMPKVFLNFLSRIPNGSDLIPPETLDKFFACYGNDPERLSQFAKMAPSLIGVMKKMEHPLTQQVEDLCYSSS